VGDADAPLRARARLAAELQVTSAVDVRVGRARVVKDGDAVSVAQPVTGPEGSRVPAGMTLNQPSLAWVA